MSRRLQDLRSLDVRPPSNRTRFVGTRLREEDAELLLALARQAKVRGLSSMARIVLEAYVESHRPARRSRS
jgi:hypothetical protein